MKPVIYFDWDGTVADSMALCVAEVRAALMGMGLPDRDDRELMRCNGPSNEESIALMGIDQARGEEYLRLRAEAELRLIPTKQRLFPGMGEALRSLAGAAELVVVSNGNEEYLRRSASFLGVAACFRQMYGKLPGVTKAQRLAQAMAAMGPRRALMVGDRAGDLEAGRANGLTTVAACYGYGSPEEWALGDRRAASVAELERLLSVWARA